MTHTVVGLFDSATEAQAAMQELVQNGFIREHIDVSNRRVSDDATTASGGEGVGDSVSNFFSSLFTDDETTMRNYSYAAQDAESIVSVQVDSMDRAELARDILDRNGAIDADERASQYNQQDFARTDTATQTTGETAIPVIEEELQVGKREVERGGARIRSRVIERPVEASVRLREEHVVVNRRPVNRPVTESDLTNFREGDIELTERAEVPVVGKQARVVEEVVVGKNVTEHEETVRDTVRRTDVDVEQLDTDVTTGTTDVNTRSAKG